MSRSEYIAQWLEWLIAGKQAFGSNPGAPSVLVPLGAQLQSSFPFISTGIVWYSVEQPSGQTILS